MNIFRLTFLLLVITFSSLQSALADQYLIDTNGGHASINAKFKHVGISWLVAEFRTFNGTFEFNEDDVSASSVSVEIDTTSLDSNHAVRDKHIRGEKYLNTAEFPTAKFVSTSVADLGDGKMSVTGNLTLHGVTKSIVIDVATVGAGETRWNDYRIGLEGITTLDLRNFGMDSFGPTHLVEMALYLEGIKQ